ncbi:hypothetical protein SANTM175S_05642 [Streptomyces antimycoticus]
MALSTTEPAARTTKQRLQGDGTVADLIHFTWDGARLAEQTISGGTATTWDYAPGTHRPVSQSTHRTLNPCPSRVMRSRAAVSEAGTVVIVQVGAPFVIRPLLGSDAIRCS